MELAISENRTILTFDRDYGELIFKTGYKPPAGVIYLRLRFFDPEEPGKIIASLIDNQEFNPENALTALDEKGYRKHFY